MWIKVVMNTLMIAIRKVIVNVSKRTFKYDSLRKFAEKVEIKVLSTSLNMVVLDQGHACFVPFVTSEERNQVAV